MTALYAVCDGESMSPSLARGARVSLDLSREARVGEVVLIQPRDGSTPVLHRLLLRLGPFVVHAGDHPRATAGIARATQVVARAASAEVPRLRGLAASSPAPRAPSPGAMAFDDILGRMAPLAVQSRSSNVSGGSLNQDALVALRKIEDNVSLVIRGKREAIRLALTTLLARGHVLLEDIPGVGKTTLARALARSLGGTFRRIQFTSDLLPSDIVGVSVFDQEARRFDFRPGPIFANVVLADEINRTTPRTQSSLLEAMSDAQVTVDTHTHNLDLPFLVIATCRTPQEHFGTYPLPESQMDRFLVRIRLGYPGAEDERRLLAERGGGDPVEALRPVTDLDSIRALQALVDTVRIDERLLDYAMAVVQETRRAAPFALGVSTRGAIAWTRAAQAHALVGGRDFALPDDFKHLAIPALAHRVVLSSQQESLGRAREEAERALADILERVPVPT